MLTYAVVDNRLELTSTGQTTETESAAVLATIGRDPSVPAGLHVLIDVRENTHSMPSLEVEARVSRFFELLGAKIGPRCAMVIADDIHWEVRARFVQFFAQSWHVRVSIFRDLEEARGWLDTR
jgi:hypothetical protein